MHNKKACLVNCKDCPGWKSSVFAELEDTEVEGLIKNKTPNILKKGQTLFMQGNPSFGLYCLGKGNIKVSKLNDEGKESIVRIASVGNVVGHRSIFAHQPYLATATAITETHACFIDKNHLLSLARRNVSVACRILFSLATDLGLSEKKVASFSHDNVRARMAAIFLLLKESHGKEIEDGILLDINLSREEMASLIGIATETLIRSISEFKDENIIRLEKKMLVILDLEKLLEITSDVT